MPGHGQVNGNYPFLFGPCGMPIEGLINMALIEFEKRAIAGAGKMPADVRAYLAHVVNNCLLPIEGYAQMIVSDQGQKAVERAKGIIKSTEDLKAKLKPFMADVTEILNTRG